MNRQKTKKIWMTLGLIALFILLGVFLLAGENFDLLRSLFTGDHSTEELQEMLAQFGIRGHITIVILSMLQVVISFLPAEPVQVLAGLTFGFPIGLLCCTVGVLLGNTLIYVLYKMYGNRLREYFVKNLHFDFDKAATSKKVILIIFVLYFLPAIPYGMICFFAASVGLKYWRYITVTLLGAIPSVCIGVGLGHMAISTSWIISAIVFGVLLILLAVLFWKKEAIFAAVNARIDRPPYSSQITVRDCGRIRLAIAYGISRIVFFFKGVRVRYVNRVGDALEKPSIVLCNHGSFVDFAYVGSLLRKYEKKPNFIVARLYFYKKSVGNLLRGFGCFPKSMFAADLGSSKNCLRVLKGGGVLAMMPEARLSTVGRFEDIQPGTYDFLKKTGKPIYTVKINGDYFADPKWGRGLRRGALIEAELELLLSAEEIAALTVEEIGARVEERLFYDEFEWIKTRPEVHYRSRRLAEGLENILTKCPKCHGKYTLRTKGHEILCERCGHLATLNDRYGFADGAPFESFAHWYDWQRDELYREIMENKDFSMISEVELRMRSIDGKRMLRVAGRGTCVLNREGLTYTGECDGEACELHFPIKQIYRLLFGAGEDFELYVGSEIYYFVPDERRCAVDWYIVSAILSDEARREVCASTHA